MLSCTFGPLTGAHGLLFGLGLLLLLSSVSWLCSMSGLHTELPIKRIIKKPVKQSGTYIPNSNVDNYMLLPGGETSREAIGIVSRALAWAPRALSPVWPLSLIVCVHVGSP